MKTRRFRYGMAGMVLAVVLVVGLSAFAPSLPIARSDELQTSPDGKGYRLEQDGWIYIHVEGEAYERGFQYGYLVAPELAEILANTKDLTFMNTGMEWEFFVEQVQEQFVRYLDDEMKGIAEGAQEAGTEITWEEVLTWNGYEDLLGY